MSSLGLRLALSVGCCLVVATARADDPPPLHVRVDALIDAAAVGPLAPQASDADFLRRIHLDLTGVIPTAADARAFLNDHSPDKRMRLIDRLLASPQYARHMALVFDVMLMERLPDKAVKTPAWQAYLRRSFADNKPLDQLCRELLTADGADEALRPAARFLLDRDCEPNLVTRDAGRMFFGMDLQCAQCHDHPVVDDYLQEDYYGLYAFFLRTSVFTDAKKKQSLVAEKAEGEASFKSVFTGNAADGVAPRLPHGVTTLPEPTFSGAEAYLVAPAKDVRPVPKHSRRAQLAAMLAESPEFRRNLANRIWAHLFGRGIVHPVDAHHVANPPSHPEVLTLLAEEFAGSHFDLQWLLRELTQTRVYQRTCDPPAPTALPTLPESELTSLQSERAPAEQRLKDLEAALTKARVDLRLAKEEQRKLRLALAPLEAETKTAQQALDVAIAAAKQPTEALTKKQEQAAAIALAAQKAQEAVKLLAEDQALSEAAAAIVARATVASGELEAARKAVADLASETEKATQRLAAASAALAQAREATTKVEHLTALERTALAAQRAALQERYQLSFLESRLALAERIVAYQKQSPSDVGAAAQAWPGLLEHWTTAGQLAPLRPLTSEQFALSLLQATGSLAQREQAAKATLESKPPEALQKAAAADRPRLLATLAEEQAFEQLRGSLNAFVALYGTQPGADFQATVNQALFFENGNVVQSQFSASGGNLTDRLTKVDDAGLLAEELYLATLSRFPTDEERQDVASYLAPRAPDRAAAVSELVWALLSSNEFRFNH